jgi:rare lipoprotein A (peptidoglycan hydrolase)
VVVTVNDYGPEQGIGRLIDLDKVAFRQIGNLKSGVIPVIIEKIKD